MSFWKRKPSFISYLVSVTFKQMNNLYVYSNNGLYQLQLLITFYVHKRLEMIYLPFNCLIFPGNDPF